MGAARVVAMLRVTIHLLERAAQPSLGEELGSAAIVRALIYLHVFQVTTVRGPSRFLKA